LLGE
jgi:hypothetical protein